MIKLKYIFLFSIYFLVLVLKAQDTIHPQNDWDTTKYQKFNNRFIVAYYYSNKSFGTEMSQVTLRDTLGRSSYNHVAESNYISGLEFNFDKFNIQIGLKSAPAKDVSRFGKTKFFSLGFNVGGNRWFLETAYRRYTGFYDKNTPNYDTSFKNTGIYRQLPNMSSSLTKARILFFRNYRNYSFRSGYACNYRQLKTAGSWVLSASVYQNSQITDSSFIPAIGKPYYRHFGDLNSVQVVGIGFNGGVTFNLVLWKAWFLNMLLTIGPDQQWRKLGVKGQGRGRTFSYMDFGGDFRISMGLNMKKFYMLVTGTADITNYNNYILKLQSTHVNSNFTIGWRFAAKTPEFYKRFQQTKLYKKL
jgi:hypothetical protein